MATSVKKLYTWKICIWKDPPHHMSLGKDKSKQLWGIPGWLSGLAPPSAQGVILETRNQVPHQAPCMEPASSSACIIQNSFTVLKILCAYSHHPSNPQPSPVTTDLFTVSLVLPPLGCHSWSRTVCSLHIPYKWLIVFFYWEMWT